MSTTTKKELIDRITQSTQAKRALVKATVQDFLGEIISELAKGNRLEFRDFGVFEPHDMTAHQGWHKTRRLSNESMSQARK